MKRQNLSPNVTVFTSDASGLNTPTETQRLAELITKASSKNTWSIRNSLQIQQYKRLKAEGKRRCTVGCVNKK